ncbi:MAG: Crp/Fnr family transcriptional regulator [Syntrophobacter sp.]
MDSSTGQERICSEYKDTVELLRNIPFFSAMPLEAVKVLACLCVRENFMEGDMIFEQDQIDEHAYLILDGEADLLLKTETGEERLRSHARGDFIGGFSLLSSVKRLFSLRAKTEVCCIVLQRDRFQKTLDQFPESAAEILKVMTFAVHQWEYRLLHGHGRTCGECKAGMGVTLL